MLYLIPLGFFVAATIISVTKVSHKYFILFMVFGVISLLTTAFITDRQVIDKREEVCRHMGGKVVGTSCVDKDAWMIDLPYSQLD